MYEDRDRDDSDEDHRVLRRDEETVKRADEPPLKRKAHNRYALGIHAESNH